MRRVTQMIKLTKTSGILLMLALTTLFVTPARVLAYTNFQLNAVNEYRPLYDPDETECAPTDDATATTTGQNLKDAFAYFMHVGLKDYQAAGIIGNLEQESGRGLDPKAQQDGSNDAYPKNGVGFGIAQWTYTARQAPLVALAKRLGKPPTDLGVQLQYVWQELNTNYKLALDGVRTSRDATEAAIYFAKLYEACALCATLENPTNPEHIRIENAIRDLKLAQDQGWVTGGAGGLLGLTGCPTATSGSDLGNKIVKIALAELGTNEGGTDNAGPSCKYQGTGCPPGEMWCADFVSWVYKQAGAPFTGGADGGWRIAATSSLQEWFMKNGTWITNPGQPMKVDDPTAPQPGDVVVYSDHTNIVVSYDGKSVKTVGGNQSNAVTTSIYPVFSTALGWGRLK
jgi:hypothetical protein